MREIGGYFELEPARGDTELHTEASLILKSARSCVAVLIACEKPRKVWAPYYVCDGALEPLRSSATSVELYPLDADFEIRDGLPHLADDERLIYVDYFGLKSSYVAELERHYGHKLWADRVQAFFARPERCRASHFNSARKFFGVPDGAYLYFPASMSHPNVAELGLSANENYRVEHLMLRLQGKTREGHRYFQDNERRNGGNPALASALTRALLRRIDYPATARARRDNYRRLHAALGTVNRISPRVLEHEPDAVPFCYPFLPPTPVPKAYLWEHGVFVPVFWRECLDRGAAGHEWEQTLAAELLALPVDQRYGEDDMQRIVATVSGFGGLE